MNVLASGLRSGRPRFSGPASGHRDRSLERTVRCRIDRSRADNVSSKARSPAARAGDPLRGRDVRVPHACAPRPWRRCRHHRQALSACPGAGARAGRAASHRSVEAAGERATFVRRQHEHAVGTCRRGAGRPGWHTERRRTRRGGRPHARSRLHPGPRLASPGVLRIRRAASRSQAISPASDSPDTTISSRRRRRPISISRSGRRVSARSSTGRRRRCSSPTSAPSPTTSRTSGDSAGILSGSVTSPGRSSRETTTTSNRRHAMPGSSAMTWPPSCRRRSSPACP